MLEFPTAGIGYLTCYIFRKYVTIYLTIVHLITADTNVIERYVGIPILLVIIRIKQWRISFNSIPL